MIDRQLSLDLGRRPALDRDAFLVAPSNASALAMVETWPTWPLGKLVLCGPAGAGKTHLAHVWAELTGATILAASDLAAGPPPAGATVIEDIDRIAGDPAREEAVFHAHNAVLAGGDPLLLTGRAAPNHWALGLPDLASRMAACTVARLDDPDDALLAGVMVKLFADRHIRADPRLVAYLLTRIDRSIAAAEDVVDRLDAQALARRRPVTHRFAAEILR